MANLKQISEHVWVYPPDRKITRPTIGVICTPTRTVLVDAGQSPTHAREVMAEVERIGAAPIERIIYTHHHWDHTFAAKTYNVPVMAHRVCYHRTIEYKEQNDWSAEYVRRVIEEVPALEPSFSSLSTVMAGYWDDFELIIPSIIVRPFRSQLALDGVTIELEFIGGSHADDSTLVTVLEDGVMFMADCFYMPPAHLVKTNAKTDVEMVKQLLTRGHHYYVDGHTGAFARDFWQTWVAMQPDSSG